MKGKKHQHIWTLVNAVMNNMKWNWDYAECLCGAIQKNCPACEGLGMIVIEKKEETSGYPQYDDICRQCKKEAVNHTKWLCDGCSVEATEWFKQREG